jgi:hypothetical protein
MSQLGQTQPFGDVRVRSALGSQAEVTALIFDVGFTPNIRHSFDLSVLQLWADFVAEVR